eukprot:5515145-Lingulodinium_polyedra.AAC.1
MASSALRSALSLGVSRCSSKVANGSRCLSSASTPSSVRLDSSYRFFMGKRSPPSLSALS